AQSATTLLKQGATYIGQHRYLVRQVGSDIGPAGYPETCAWLHGLPPWITDLDLSLILPKAYDWLIVSTASATRGRSEKIAKVWFASPDERADSVKVQKFQNYSLSWSNEPICAICHGKDHQAS